MDYAQLVEDIVDTLLSEKLVKGEVPANRFSKERNYIASRIKDARNKNNAAFDKGEEYEGIKNLRGEVASSMQDADEEDKYNAGLSDRHVATARHFAYAANKELTRMIDKEEKLLK